MSKIVCLFLIALTGASALKFNVTNRLTQGSVAADGQFPYMVSLQQINMASPTRGHICGGVLITLQHVLTAASCLFIFGQDGSQVAINLQLHRVFAGASTLSNDADPNRVRGISSAHVHPNFIASSHLNDIAVLTLANPFINSTSIRALPLPGPLVGPQEMTTCTVAGWGSDNTTPEITPSLNLKFATKYVYSQSLCQKVFAVPPSDSPNVFPSMLCAASLDIISTGCIGDEGGPLVCDGLLSGIFVYTNKCEAIGRPELYTRVSNYTVWARSITGAASTFQPGVLVFVFALVQIFVSKFVN